MCMEILFADSPFIYLFIYLFFSSLFCFPSEFFEAVFQKWEYPKSCFAGSPGERHREPRKAKAGSHEVQSWTRATKQSLCLVWQKVKLQLMLSMSFLAAVFWYCRRLYSFLAQLLTRWSSYLQRKLIKNRSVLEEVDLLAYSAREWREETKQAKHMREAYSELFQNYHIKYLRQVRKDNYCVLRAVLFQIFSQGIPFPSWMRERDILKLPEKLLYSQGCNWIQQYSFGPESYTGPNAFGKLRRCMETLKTNSLRMMHSNWMFVQKEVSRQHGKQIHTVD
ncbi:inactive ubiquitin thioesterase OTULINL isoform X4 [Tympanuchus pallidicinctus]|uniref:inactive ubiquitin thioesterase OTULINL isoform X4 n=1 Tax=Tympanuchus pallidicinctus TaxID=109042 RepID=UPI0022875B49|nr:inactive ubiquitin thioesterase OTULINL isoform X4 [Tympanuchus pallidicinctus]